MRSKQAVISKSPRSSIADNNLEDYSAHKPNGTVSLATWTAHWEWRQQTTLTLTLILPVFCPNSEQASPDLMRSMLTTFINALMSAKAASTSVVAT